MKGMTFLRHFGGICRMQGPHPAAEPGDSGPLRGMAEDAGTPTRGPERRLGSGPGDPPSPSPGKAGAGRGDPVRWPRAEPLAVRCIQSVQSARN